MGIPDGVVVPAAELIGGRRRPSQETSPGPVGRTRPEQVQEHRDDCVVVVEAQVVVAHPDGDPVQLPFEDFRPVRQVAVPGTVGIGHHPGPGVEFAAELVQDAFGRAAVPILEAHQAEYPLEARTPGRLVLIASLELRLPPGDGPGSLLAHRPAAS